MNNNHQSALSMHFNTNGRLNENNFKISLRSPPLKPVTLQSTPPTATTPTTVTSTNPKTPSPSTNDVNHKIFLIKPILSGENA